MNSRAMLCTVTTVVALCSACNFRPPRYVYTDDVEQDFSEIQRSSHRPRIMSAAAGCQSALNGHRQAASRSYTLRTAFAVAGGVIAGTTGSGGALTATLSTDPIARNIGGGVATGGAVIGVVGTTVGAVLTDPSTEMAARTEKLNHYLTAVSLASQLATETDEAKQRQWANVIVWELNACRDPNTTNRPPLPNPVPTITRAL